MQPAGLEYQIAATNDLDSLLPLQLAQSINIERTWLVLLPPRPVTEAIEDIVCGKMHRQGSDPPCSFGQYRHCLHIDLTL